MNDLNLDSLTALRVLGRGAMGTVFLVLDRSSPSTPPFALKVVHKAEKKQNARTRPDSDRRARWEATVLSRLSHPFLPSLLGRLETPDLLAWALPFCPGGDLNALRYLQSDRVFSTSAIRFYASELVAALSHLHRLGIVYRDLKPENVLVQSSGHVALTDFDLSRYLSPTATTTTTASSSPSLSPSPSPSPSPPQPRRHRRSLTRLFFSTPNHDDPHSLAKDSQHHHLKKAKSARVLPVTRRRSNAIPIYATERSNSFVGTEEYVAPEVIRGEGHEFAVDWWALGVLVYEMAYGRTPFRGRNRKETFQNVLMRPPEFVGRQRTELTDLIGRLLAKDPTRRLGFRGGADEVKAHAFFRGVQWDILSEVDRPPFVPPVDEGDAGAAEGFDIREYFRKEREEKEAAVVASPMGSPLPSSVSLTEF